MNSKHGNRIETLDVLRGIALIGILIVNISLMKTLGLWSYSYGMNEPREGVDKWLGLMIDLFVEGSFISIFSILFGVGFFIFMERAEQKRARVYLLFTRRLVFLALFGLCHLIFLWMGDILFYYAITGFLLLIFYRRKNKTILITAISSIVFFFLLLASQLIMPASMISDMQNDGQSFIQETTTIYERAPSVEWFLFRLQHEVPMVVGQVFFLIPYILGMFLFGFLAGRKQWFHEPDHHQRLFTRMRLIGFLTFVPVACLLIILETGVLSAGVYHHIFKDILLRFGSIFLSFTYISGITLAIQKHKQILFASRFAAMGRMALTNYLMQTILSLTIIFGFDLFSIMPLWQGILLSMAIICLQMVLSPLWLQKFRYGPMEWLWRKLTYGQMKSRKTTDEPGKTVAK